MRILNIGSIYIDHAGTAATVHAGSVGKHAEWLLERLRQEGVDKTFVFDGTMLRMLLGGKQIGESGSTGWVIERGTPPVRRCGCRPAER